MLLYILPYVFTGRYRACYHYSIESGEECELDLATLDVDIVQSFSIPNSTLIMVNTPVTSGRVYPPNLICFFVIGNK